MADGCVRGLQHVHGRRAQPAAGRLTGPDRADDRTHHTDGRTGDVVRVHVDEDHVGADLERPDGRAWEHHAPSLVSVVSVVSVVSDVSHVRSTG
jgi:hypothetical protein